MIFACFSDSNSEATVARRRRQWGLKAADAPKGPTVDDKIRLVKETMKEKSLQKRGPRGLKKVIKEKTGTEVPRCHPSYNKTHN